MNNIRVIVAEDIEIIRKNYIEHIAEDDKLEIVAGVATGKECVEVFQEKGADIILLDVEMESSTAGLEASKQISALSSDVKIIFLTVREDDATIINAFGVGAVDYVMKSANTKDVISRIKKAYHDKVEMDLIIQRVLRNELQRTMKNNQDIMEFAKKLATLTMTEREIINLLLKDYKVKDIANERFVEIVTIKTQISALLKKFDMRRTKEITKQIKQMGFEDLF